ncbi:MAG TPA: response regulator [Candidatus Xenobia bacterium]|jgi:CheY-like chemotaxis protein
MARILVVDDETTIRMMIRMALEWAPPSAPHFSHEVAVADEGEAGLQAYGNGQAWDLVLLDQRMPGLEGIEVLRRMRERNPSARIMMVTAFGTIDLAFRAMQAGATDFLRKPFTADILRGAVQQALQAPPAETSRFGQAAINGFRFSSLGDNRFRVRNPVGEQQEVQVQLQPALRRQVEKIVPGPVPDPWWQELAEEVLANHVWQHSDFPPAELRVEELTTGLRRWIDAILTRTA